MTNKHQKHAKLTRPNYGQFARNEWAIIGTPCGNIQQLAYQLIDLLSKEYKVSYVDADHKNADSEDVEETKTAMAFGAHLEYTDKITHHRFDTKTTLNNFQFRQYFNEQDVVLVNGNHFKAKKQIVVIDPKKEKSLQKKLDRLTDVRLILMTEEAMSIPTYLEEQLEDIDKIPTFSLNDLPSILKIIQDDLKEQTPILNGLVLAGGKSQRMGQDKGLISYHGQPQREYVADLLASFCKETFISFRQGQAKNSILKYPIIEDRFQGLGPFGAIASAFLHQPNHAWLVVACDLPLLDEFTLKYLVDNRQASNIATAYNSPVNEFPEPLIAIWEPKSYPVLLQFLAQGYSCPRKVLINSDVHLLDAPEGHKLMNVNHPEELEKVKKELENKTI